MEYNLYTKGKPCFYIIGDITYRLVKRKLGPDPINITPVLHLEMEWPNDIPIIYVLKEQIEHPLPLLEKIRSQAKLAPFYGVYELQKGIV